MEKRQKGDLIEGELPRVSLSLNICDGRPIEMHEHKSAVVRDHAPPLIIIVLQLLHTEAAALPCLKGSD